MIDIRKENFKAVSNGLIKKQKKEFAKSCLKCIAFYVVAYPLFLASDLDDMISGVFWIIILLIATIPIIMFKPYKIFSKIFTGTVTAIKDDTAYGERKISSDSIKPNLVFMDNVDVCNVKVQNDDGTVKKFHFRQSHLANFARSYYLLGDKLTLPKHAKYPYNESRSPSHPFCLGCGHIGNGEEKICPDCKTTFVLPEE